MGKKAQMTDYAVAAAIAMNEPAFPPTTSPAMAMNYFEVVGLI